MNKLKKYISLVLAIAIMLSLPISVSAASKVHLGNDVNEIAVYRYELKYSIWPWTDAFANTSSSFLVEPNVIAIGFVAYSAVMISSLDTVDVEYRSVYVETGSNNADTGDLYLAGHRKDTYSMHASVYPALDINENAMLSFEE